MSDAKSTHWRILPGLMSVATISAALNNKNLIFDGQYLKFAWIILALTFAAFIFFVSGHTVYDMAVTAVKKKSRKLWQIRLCGYGAVLILLIGEVYIILECL